MTHLSHDVSAQTDVKQVTVKDHLQHASAVADRDGRKPNKLIDESSPYLLQHAYNPVDWYAWGEAAFEKARKENKPIFLSIGYSTCHWCHVMARESFENKQIAELLNRYFVSIKVDREQRPDIDAVYMAATQLINGHGGWPMTVFLDNRLRPFHAATYYPPFSSDGRKGLNEILLKVHEIWQEQPELVEETATTITAGIEYGADDTSEAELLADDITEAALHSIYESYEPDSGGFSVAPKFPRPGIFSFLNQLLLSDSDAVDDESKKKAHLMMKTTLDAMAAGGIYDQVGGGFHRYSVDENWQVPHFEKMLYNQALMVMAYNDFYMIDALPSYRRIILQTLSFVSREMRSADGGFYSALDAVSKPAHDDSAEKAEGAYYLWRQSELKRVLPAQVFAFVKKYYQVEDDGNIESDPHDQFIGLNVLYVDDELSIKPLTQQQAEWLASARKQLNKVRIARPRPHLDDKIITAWNGMMISALAISSRTFDERALLLQAEQAAEFIRKNLYDENATILYRQYRRHGEKTVSDTAATLSDYVWLIHGLIELYEASNDDNWLRWAFELHEQQDALFLDEKTGAYFESVATDDSLLFRSKSISDGALPSANAVAFSNLYRLSALASRPADKKIFSSRAAKLLKSFATTVNQYPLAAAMLLAVELEHGSNNDLEVRKKATALQ
ncbi:MAG: thioredoxin domain-containing protein [Gammaproteobacteria bacterium]|nr:thioredoxin domain-containing protein [Gammaproteobacteria bacterium]